MELLGDVGLGKSCFSPFGNGVSVVQDRCMVCAKRSIGLEIILEEANGTPR
jgi:hypothetical protein